MWRISILILTFFLILQACSEPTSSPRDGNMTVGEDQTHPSSVSEQDISVGALHGAYINAGSGTPIALIVPGSGPTDRDGNQGKALQSNVCKHLAYQLADKGISTVRVDKRGMYSSAEAGNPNAVTLEIYTKDYRDWIDAIKAKSSAKCIYLLGHSEGGLMVSSAAVGRKDVCGLILVSTPGRPLGTILREQLKANPANFFLLKQALAAITKLENGQHVDTKKMNRALLPLFRDSVQDYWISILVVDPASMAAKAKQRTLIVQGGNDLQVSIKDAELLAEATDGDLVIFGKVNHVLKNAPRDRRGNLKIYNKPDLPVADGVITAVADFMLSAPLDAK